MGRVACAMQWQNAETERVMFAFAPTGRSVTWRFTQGVASLTLG